MMVKVADGPFVRTLLRTDEQNQIASDPLWVYLQSLKMMLVNTANTGYTRAVHCHEGGLVKDGEAPRMSAYSWHVVTYSVDVQRSTLTSFIDGKLCGRIDDKFTCGADKIPLKLTIDSQFCDQW